MSLSPGAFEKLLAVLGPERELAAANYERIRLRLLRFFEWRRADCPEDLADRTIDRVGKRLEDGDTIRASDPAAYFYGVARNVLKEHWSEKKREMSAVSRLGDLPPVDQDPESERRFRCLEECLEALPMENRGLVLDYYVGRGIGKIENRRRTALRLGVAPNALRIRMHRLRAGLEQCVERCMGGSAGRNVSESLHTTRGKDGGA
jgi:DNA-directed RNA polymerase specialized sigma24 family protein